MSSSCDTPSALVGIENPAVMPARLLCAPPGVGKTHAIIQSLAERPIRAIYAAPTHDLCIEVQKRMQAAGIDTHYWREGPDESDACPHADLVAFYRAFGYLIRRGPCLHCIKRNECAYRKVFTGEENQTAQVLIVTSWHLRRSDFWDLKATEDRGLLILDEDASQALAAPIEITFESIARFMASLQSIRDQCGEPFKNDDRSEEAAWLVRSQQQPEEGSQAALALTDLLRRACLDLAGLCAGSSEGKWLKEPPMQRWMEEYDHQLLSQDNLFETLLAFAYGAVGNRVEIPNLFAALRGLLRYPCPLHSSPGAVRWPTSVPLPADRKLAILDATAEPAVLEGIIKRPIEVLSIPQVEQKARIHQIMDKLLTRGATRRDMGGKDDAPCTANATCEGRGLSETGAVCQGDTPDKPDAAITPNNGDTKDSFILAVATEVAKKHINDKLLVITFLRHEEQLRKHLKAIHPAVTVLHYGALRGLDSYGDFGAGLIIGRPMPNEARLALLAVSAFGIDALESEASGLKPPELEWVLQEYPLGQELWEVRCQRYIDQRWQAAWNHVVTGELLQAIGRLRPLSNPADIYVLTCEPVPPVFDMKGAYASELFPTLRLINRRTDFAGRVRKYADAMQALQAEGLTPTNAAVCQRIGIRRKNGGRYRKLALEMLADKKAGIDNSKATPNAE